MFISKNCLFDLVQKIIYANTEGVIERIEKEFERIECKPVRLSKSIQPVVAQVTIIECAVGNVIQSMSENTSCSEVILKGGVRLGTNVRATILYPPPVSVE